MGAGFGIAADCSAIASSASVDVGMTVGVSYGHSFFGESTEPATGTVSDSVTGSSMTILLIGSVGCVCGAYGADTTLSVADVGTAYTLAVPPQSAQHSAEEARTVLAMILRFFITCYLHVFSKQHISQTDVNSQTLFQIFCAMTCPTVAAASSSIFGRTYSLVMRRKF